MDNKIISHGSLFIINSETKTCGQYKRIVLHFRKSVNTSYSGILVFQTLNFPNLKLPDFLKKVIPQGGSNNSDFTSLNDVFSSSI